MTLKINKYEICPNGQAKMYTETLPPVFTDNLNKTKLKALEIVFGIEFNMDSVLKTA